jgi:hypothetical protein
MRRCLKMMGPGEESLTPMARMISTGQFILALQPELVILFK